MFAEPEQFATELLENSGIKREPIGNIGKK